MTLIGWGSTDGVIQEAREILDEEGITANQLQIRWMVPLHGDAIVEILKNARHTIIVENNYSGQFARYLRSETSFVARRPHPEVRRRAVYAAPHCGGGKRTTGRADQAVGSNARNHGLRGESWQQPLHDSSK